MTYKDVSVCISSVEADFGLIDQAVAVANTWQSHLSCCAIGIQPVPVYADNFMGAFSDLSIVIQAGEEAFQAFWNSLNVHIEDSGAKLELRSTRTFDGGVAEVAAIFSRYSDLLIARMPDASDRAHRGEIIEGALFASGHPVLALPENWKPRPLGQKVLIAWDASREAARAIHDALPLLSPAAEAYVVTVDAAPTSKGHGASPGLDIATHLARHGVNVTVRNESSLGKRVGERLVDIASGLDADTIIMGGYRHSKLAQRIVAGPSSFLISKSPVSVFLSH